jgi:hypothetical protein
MIDFITASFRTIITVSAWIALLACGAFGLAVMAGGGGVFGVIAFVASALLLVMFYGTVCLMIQNNELLKRIAERQ